MAMEEKDIYAELGIEPPSQQPGVAVPAGQGANEPSVTGAAGRENQATDNHQDTASSVTGARAGDGGTGDPSPTENGGQIARAGEDGERIAAGPEGPRNDNNGTDGQAAGAAGEDGKGTMSRAERAEQARLRREREQKAAVDAAVQAALQAEREKHNADLKAMFEKAGMVDRYHDNKPITSMEEFQAFQQARQADRLGRELQSGKLTPESFQAAVENSPAFRAAQAAVERLEAREREQTEAANRAAFEQKVRQELETIHSLYPGVTTLEDILALDTGPEFARLVRDNGLTYEQAFRLANGDRIAEARAAAAAEGRARQQQSKGHLRSIGAGGQVSVDVPPDVIANYRMFDPGITMEEIRKDYAKRYRS